MTLLQWFKKRDIDLKKNREKFRKKIEALKHARSFFWRFTKTDQLNIVDERTKRECYGLSSKAWRICNMILQ